MLAIDIVRQLLQYQARYRSTDAAPHRPGKHPRVEEGSGEGDASNWNSIPNVLKHMIGSHVPLESARMNLVERDAAGTIDYQPKTQGCAHPLTLKNLRKYLSKFRTTINLQRCIPDDKQAVQEIAQVIRNGVVTTLDLSDNHLDAEAGKALAAALKVNSVLTKLDVGYNLMNEEAALAIVRAVRPRDIMTSIGLAYCKIGPTGAKEIAAYVKGSGVLTNLNLANNKFGKDMSSILALADALKSSSSVLTNLNLAANGLDAEAGKALADALSVNGVLTKLDVSDNKMNEESALAIVRAVRSRDIMADLGLAGCEIGAEGAKEIAEYMKVSGVLTNLNLAITGTDILELADALKSGSSVLKELNLYNNGIGSEGATALADALRVNGVLTTLNLSFNDIGSDGAKELADALNESVLTSLNLTSNNLCGIDDYGHGEYDASGIQALASAMSDNRVLTSLELRDNAVQSEEAKALADALKGNGVLTSLDLSLNMLRAEAAKALADAIRVNRVLKKLYLTDNPIGYDRSIDPEVKKSVVALADALEVNGVLKTFDMRSNLLDEALQQILKDAVKGRASFELLL